MLAWILGIGGLITMTIGRLKAQAVAYYQVRTATASQNMLTLDAALAVAQQLGGAAIYFAPSLKAELTKIGSVDAQGNFTQAAA